METGLTKAAGLLACKAKVVVPRTGLIGTNMIEGREDMPKTVYLSGGMRNNWRGRVKKEAYGFRYLDPCEHGLDEPAQYTAWDLRAIEESDFVFAYLEADNPSGYGLALEIGYAAALGKLVVFVDEKSANDNPAAKYLAIVRHCANITVNLFDDGIRILKSLEKIYNGNI